MVLLAVVVSCGDDGVSTSGPNAPTSTTVVPQSTATTVTSSTGAASPSTAAPSVPVSTVAATTVVVPPSTTSFPDDAMTVVIDLTRPASQLEPRVVASRPWSTTDGIPNVVVAPAGPGQIAVLDAIDGVVEFIDTDTGEAVRTTALPLADEARPCCWMFVGPDDVLYVNQIESGLPEFVAYAPTDAGYREVARTMHGTGDSTLMLGATGITGLGFDPPVVPFVGVDGQPSGATLPVEPFQFSPSGDGIGRGESAWQLSYIGQRLDSSGAIQPGPGRAVVVTEGLLDEPWSVRMVLLDGNSVHEWDSAWWYVGPIADALIVDRIVGDQIEVGVVAV